MLWFRKELVTVCALVLVTVSAWWCDMTKVTTFDEDAMTDPMYMVLTTRRSKATGFFGFNNSIGECEGPLAQSSTSGSHASQDVQSGGNRCLKVMGFKTNMSVCQTFCAQCEITDNFCRTSGGMKIHVVTSDPDHVVTFSHRPNNTGKSMDIYIKADSVNRNNVGIRDLSKKLRRKIRNICGGQATRPAFYVQYEVRDYIPDCIRNLSQAERICNKSYS